MKQKLLICIMVLSMMLVGCSTNIHTVGTGPQSGMTKVARQYYLLYGLIPINTVNTNEMAKSMNANVVTLSGFSLDNPLWKLGDINLWVDSKAYNIVEMTHHIWLLALVDYIVGHIEYSASWKIY